jgi:hypothetical protein
MKLPLRLTYQNLDIMFYILNEKPTGKNLIDVSIEGHTYQLYKTAGGWVLKNTNENPDRNLINAIGNVLSLRYRI